MRPTAWFRFPWACQISERCRRRSRGRSRASRISWAWSRDDLGLGQALGQLVVALRVPVELFAVAADGVHRPRQRAGDLVLPLQQLAQLRPVQLVSDARGRGRRARRRSSARRATAGSSIQSLTRAWPTTSMAVCSAWRATNTSLLSRPRVMGT